MLKLDSPTEEWLVSIANFRFGTAHEPLHRAIAKRLKVLRDAAVRQNMREPSTAEYLDALAACQRLGIDQTSPEWRMLEQAVLWKREDTLPPAHDEGRRNAGLAAARVSRPLCGSLRELCSRYA